MNRILLFLLVFSFLPAKSQVKHIVQVFNHRFEPNQLTIALGDTVRWVWMEGTHTTTSVSIPNGGIPWSQNLDTNNRSFNYVPTAYGNHGYFCQIHGFNMNMTGVIGVWDPNSLSEVSPDNKIRLFPNPAVETVSFEIPVNSDYAVVDVKGQIVKYGSVPAGRNTLDVGMLSPGNYMVSFRGRDGSVFNSSFIRKS